jgi:hypothetical protein
VEFNIECDLEHYKKYPRVDDKVIYKKKGKDVRGEIKIDPKVNLPDYSGPFKADLRLSDFSKEALVKMQLMAHEYFMLIMECWAKEVAMRYGLDAMFDILNAIWSNPEVLKEIKALREKYMNITGHDIESLMKDFQVDTTALPGKYFECTYEMPEKDVGIYTFLKCKAVDQWEALERPDILEKHCQVTCPESIIGMAKLYNPNIKVEILAIPPRKSKNEVCCKWRFTMRKESDHNR